MNMPGLTRLTAVVSTPLFRRLGFHLRRMTNDFDLRFFVRVLLGLLGLILLAALVVTLVEGPRGSIGEFFGSLGAGFYWGITTVLGAGDASYVNSPVGWLVSWLLVLFGVAIVTAITGAMVGFFIDVLLKEGQGMGAAGYRDHIVVCGWNSTARELLEELDSDEYEHRIVLLHDADKNPAGRGVYFVSGDHTNSEDLRRAGIEDAASAIVCPVDSSNEADMRSILTVMAIESIAPHVRTVVEANNPAHVEHLQRAKANEIVVSSRIASRLMARSSLYPGLAEIVTDIVSGGAGSELYRVELPTSYVGLSVDELSTKFRSEHCATLLAVSRNAQPVINPPADFRMQPGDDAVVVAQSLGGLSPLAVPRP